MPKNNCLKCSKFYKEMSDCILRKRKKNRRAWRLVTVVLSIFIVIGGAFFFYLHLAEKPKKEAEKEALDRISGQIYLKDKDKFYLYNGVKETYYVLTGKNKENKNIIVWVPKKKTGKIYVKYADTGITKEEAKKKVLADKKPKKFLKETLGMENGVALWEVSYLDQNNKLNYYELAFSDGEPLRQIENL